MVYHKDDNVLMLARKDKKNVLILSTWHKNQTEPARRVTKMNEEKTIQKLSVISDYNKNKGGMHAVDQYMSSYSFTRKLKKLWPAPPLFKAVILLLYVGYSESKYRLHISLAHP